MSHWKNLAKKLGDGSAPRGFDIMRRMIRPVLTYAQIDEFMIGDELLSGDAGAWEWVDANYSRMFKRVRHVERGQFVPRGDFGCRSVLNPNRPAADSPLWVTLKKHLTAHSPRSRVNFPDSNFYVDVPVEVAMPYGRE
jgi:hypothetical protein